MDTTSGNQLIEAFMPEYPIVFTDILGNPFPIPLTEYHNSWHALMPVVEHIESLGFASVIEKVAWKTSVIHRVWFTSLEGKQKEVAGARDEDKKTAVWLAVVAFIQWYNEKK